MLFSSFIFLCFFLPLTVGIYYILPQILRNTFLLIVSLIFYGWSDLNNLAQMFIIAGAVYLGAVCIDKTPHYFYRKILLVAFLSFIIGIFFFYKYMGFTLSWFPDLELSPVLSEILLPIGISFYTFQAISYLVDSYRKTVEVQKNPFRLLLYISLFPQLIAGPIVRYKDVCAQLTKRYVNLTDIGVGFNRFLMGLGKKVIIANTLAISVDKIFEVSTNHLSVPVVWMGMVLYSLQLYFDFSGYSDMAIGLGRMFGFRFLENFNYPYISRSITEFWRRWHMSLSGWFREYVYIPLGGNKNGLLKTVFNLAIVFLLTGIWHGAAWTFVLWGIWHGFFIICEKIIKFFMHIPQNFITKGMGHVYALMVVMIGWVLFRSDTIAYAVDYLKVGVGLKSTSPDYGIGYYISSGGLCVALIGIVLAFGGGRYLIDKMQPSVWGRLVLNISMLGVLGLSVVLLTASGYNPFIYFRF